MENCKCLNKKLVYLIAKNGVKMYFYQCFECGKTSDKFLPQHSIDLKIAIEYDIKIQEGYKKEQKQKLKESKLNTSLDIEKKQKIKTTKQAKIDWHKQNKPIALEVYGGKCGHCAKSTTIKEGVIHHYSYPAGVYLEDVKNLIDKKICVWICKDCHEKVHTADSIEDIETGFYKILGKCSLCGSKTSHGHQRAKDYGYDIDYLCQFCADGTNLVLMQYYEAFLYKKPNRHFKYMDLMDFIEKNFLSKNPNKRRKVIHKVKMSGIIIKTVNSAYVFSESHIKYMEQELDKK